MGRIWGPAASPSPYCDTIEDYIVHSSPSHISGFRAVRMVWSVGLLSLKLLRDQGSPCVSRFRVGSVYLWVPGDLRKS